MAKPVASMAFNPNLVPRHTMATLINHSGFAASLIKVLNFFGVRFPMKSPANKAMI